MFDPLGIEQDKSWNVARAWDDVLRLVSHTFDSNSSARKDRPTSGRGAAGVNVSPIYHVNHLKIILVNNCCLSPFNFC